MSQDIQTQIVNTTFTTTSGQSIQLKLTQMMAEGGEGSIWRGPKKNQCIKIFHQWDPKLLEHKAKKLQALMSLQIEGAVLPLELLMHPKLGVCGYIMPLVDATNCAQMTSVQWQAKKKLSLGDLIELIENMRQVLLSVHQAGITVGDLNEFNWMCDIKLKKAYLIDCDSWGLPGHKVSALMSQIKDPLNSKPNTQSDWYAFAMLCTYLLVGARAYSGTHPTMGRASAQQRQAAGASIFDASVRLAGSAKNPQAIPNPLKSWLTETLSHKTRAPMPSLLFAPHAATYPLPSPTFTPEGQYLGSGLYFKENTIQDFWGLLKPLFIASPSIPRATIKLHETRFVLLQSASQWFLQGYFQSAAVGPPQELKALQGCELISFQSEHLLFLKDHFLYHYKLVFLKTAQLVLVQRTDVSQSQRAQEAFFQVNFGSIVLSAFDRAHGFIKNQLTKSPGPGWYLFNAQAQAGYFALEWNKKGHSTLCQLITPNGQMISLNAALCFPQHAPLGAQYAFDSDALYLLDAGGLKPLMALPSAPKNLWFEEGLGSWMYEDAQGTYQAKSGVWQKI